MIKKYQVWVADLEPAFGTEPGKVRPVVVVQSDLLNVAHPSTLICPITTNILPTAKFLRVHLSAGEANLSKASDILVDQLRSVDNLRLVKKLGTISPANQQLLDENLAIVLDLG
jgi:mRNA interferase MazF